MLGSWNSFSESVISAHTTDSFKYKLDKFWSNQELQGWINRDGK